MAMMKLNEIIYANFLAHRKYSKNGNVISPALNLCPLFHEFPCGVDVKHSFGIRDVHIQTLA